MDRTSPTGFSNAIENWHNGFHNNASWPNFHDPRLNIRDDRFWQFHKFIDNRFKKWLKDNDDFNESCGRDRDEILSEPGGTDSQNIVGFRTDGIDWSFKYLSAREIDPLAEAVPDVPTTPEIPEPETPEVPVENAPSLLPLGVLITNSSHYQDGTATIGSIDLNARKVTTRTHGDVGVTVIQDGQVLGVSYIEASDLDINYQQLSVPIGPIEVSGSYQVQVFFYGAGYIAAGEI